MVSATFCTEYRNDALSLDEIAILTVAMVSGLLDGLFRRGSMNQWSCDVFGSNCKKLDER